MLKNIRDMKLIWKYFEKLQLEIQSGNNTETIWSEFKNHLRELDQKYQNASNQKDYKTGAYLYNEENILDILKTLSKKHLKIYYLRLDISDLSVVNKNKGHREGDKVLKLFSKYIHQYFSSEDYIFRFGGDEFDVIVSDLRDSSMEETIEILKESSKDIHFHISGSVYKLDNISKASLYKVQDEVDRKLFLEKNKKK